MSKSTKFSPEVRAPFLYIVIGSKNHRELHEGEPISNGGAPTRHSLTFLIR